MKDLHHAAAIAQRHPHLADLPITLLSAGLDHSAFLIADRHVLRIPHDASHAAQLAREAAITARLCDHLPLPIPRYEHVADDHAIYALVPGQPALPIAPDTLDLRAVGAAMGGFLRALHDVDPELTRALGAPADDDPGLEAWREGALGDLHAARPLLDDLALAHLNRYLSRLPPLSQAAPRQLHGDLAAEHILLDEAGQPCGVIDWSDLHIGDIAHDLAGLLHWGGPLLLDAALDVYGPIDDDARLRAAWLATCRAAGDLRFGLERGRPEYIAGGLQALAHLKHLTL